VFILVRHSYTSEKLKLIMKNLIFLSLFLPFAAKAQFTIVNTSTTDLVELRSGDWPLSLQRIIKESDTCYALQFRDEGYSTESIMATLRFPNLEQLRYFQKALSALKKGSTGDIAKFKDYTLKRLDVKKEGVSYVLNCSLGETTNFRQSDADKIIATVSKL
jgi:hypothetical protein